jgi:hypothetical protein
MAKRLPWFKVQARLTSNQKFRKLNPALRGHLLSLWCCAADQPERGVLPGMREIAYHLGDTSFLRNPSRIIPRVIHPLIESGFIEVLSNKYYMHDWDYWQTTPGTTENDVLPPAEQPAEQPLGQPAVDSVVDNKQDTLFNVSPRGIESKNTIIPNGIIDSEQSKRVSCKRKNNTADERYIPLKAFMEQEYANFRKITLGSATLTKDWVRITAMLHRTKDDSSYSLQRLCNAFTRWLASNSNYDKSMSIAQWADNVHRYINADTKQFPRLVSASSTKYANPDIGWWMQEE